MLDWFKAAGIRAIRSIAGTALSLLGANLVGLTDVDWWAIANVSLMTGVISLLIAIKGLPEIPAEQIVPERMVD